MPPPPKEVQEAVTRVLQPLLDQVDELPEEDIDDRLLEFLGVLLFTMDYFQNEWKFLKTASPQIKNAVAELIYDGHQGMDLSNDGLLNVDDVYGLKENIKDQLEIILRAVKDLSVAKDLSAVQKTEKEFLSKKVPKDVADNIASYLTGKKGSVGAQMSQVRTDIGKSGVPSKGGRKTKKKRSSKKKTHGRRV